MRSQQFPFVRSRILAVNIFLIPELSWAAFGFVLLPSIDPIVEKNVSRGSWDNLYVNRYLCLGSQQVTSSDNIPETLLMVHTSPTTAVLRRLSWTGVVVPLTWVSRLRSCVSALLNRDWGLPNTAYCDLIWELFDFWRLDASSLMHRKLDRL
jgi:hypothetical protein